MTTKEQEIENTPAKSRGIVEKALAGKASPRQAIKARCLQCANYQREEIRLCPVANCVLWEYRPFQDQEAESEGEPEAEI